MQIIQNIIEELIQTEKSLTSPLFKAKFLANKIGNTTLLEWVNNELNGYTVLIDERGENVPSYRKHGASLVGSYFVGYAPFDNMLLPTFGLDEEVGKFMRTVTLYDSVASLEKMASDNKFDQIALNIPPELCSIIQSNIGRSDSRFRLLSARKIASSTVVNQSLTSIRSTFLDFMMELDTQFGGITNLDELKQKNEQITTIMNHTIINNTGDGALINTGHKARIDSRIEVKKGNFESLAQKLSENQVSHQDIEELKVVLEQDEPNKEKGLLGDRANSWITKMITKSLDGTWQIGTGAAGGLLVEAIKTYYGW